MSDSSIFLEVSGGRELVDWLGFVPTFHDAEILNLYLDRSGESVLRVHTWRTTNAVDARGYYVRDKHVLVTLTMDKITGLKLEGFSGQNVIDRLRLKRYASGCEILGKTFPSSAAPSATDVGIELDAIFGLGGVIFTNALKISFIPSEPDGSPS